MQATLGVHKLCIDIHLEGATYFQSVGGGGGGGDHQLSPVHRTPKCRNPNIQLSALLKRSKQAVAYAKHMVNNPTTLSNQLLEKLDKLRPILQITVFKGNILKWNVCISIGIT